MEIFANQKIQWKENKQVRRTVVVRATLSQMNCINGVIATLPGQGSFAVLRWGECKKHNKSSTTRRTNVFQLFMFGQPQWICETLIENAQHVARVIYASTTVGLYKIKYSTDFIPPTRKLSAHSMPTTKSTINEMTKICSSPSLPSLNSLNTIIPQFTTASLPSIRNLTDFTPKVSVVLPKLNDFYL